MSGKRPSQSSLDSRTGPTIRTGLGSDFEALEGGRGEASLVELYPKSFCTGKEDVSDVVREDALETQSPRSHGWVQSEGLVSERASECQGGVGGILLRRETDTDTRVAFG